MADDRSDRYETCIWSAHLCGTLSQQGTPYAGTCTGKKDGVGCSECRSYRKADAGESLAATVGGEGLDAEMGMISDPLVRRFVDEVLREVPASFWTLPASKTGKYHPRECLGEGGLVRHVKRAVSAGAKMAEVLGLTEAARDSALAAIILHDCLKYGESGESKSGHRNHGWAMANFIINLMDKGTLPLVAEQRGNELLGKHIGLICGAVMRHSGRWHGPREDRPKNKVDWVVHLADIAAAHRFDQGVADGRESAAE